MSRSTGLGLTTIAVLSLGACCQAPVATTLPLPHSGPFERVEVDVVTLPDGVKEVRIRPWEAWARNRAAEKREREELRAAPWWAGREAE